jgi:transposase
MVVKLCIQGEKCNEIRERFHKPGPTDKAIHELLNKFNRTGSVHDEERPGCPSTRQQNVELVHEIFEEDPGASICSASQRLAIPRSTVHKILKSKLKKKMLSHSSVA